MSVNMYIEISVLGFIWKLYLMGLLLLFLNELYFKTTVVSFSNIVSVARCNPHK